MDALLRRYRNKEDKRESQDLDQWFISVATFGLYLHSFVCYIGSYYHKTGDEWLVDRIIFFLNNFRHCCKNCFEFGLF